MKYRLCVVSLLLFISAATFAQNIKVSGVVISAEDKEPIIGASVTVKDNTSIGTATDLDGNFSLNVPAGSKTLVISYIGMKTMELPVKEEMNIVMQSDDQMLGEVVVTGLGKVDKRLFTGATDKLDAATTKLDGIVDVSRALEGRSAGVSVQNVSGTFGTAPKIRVRGATSIYGSSKPLWVVDGVVMENIKDVSADDLSSGDAVTLISSAIAGLNSEDIESFQILKDGSATSIYGARAMAGVIVITTKKGRPGVSNINYVGEFTYRLKPSYNEFNIMNSQDQMGIYKELNDKGWLNFAESYRASNSGVYGKMYQLINTYDPATGTFALQNTLEEKNAYLRNAEMRNTNWFDQLFNSNVMQSHSVSVSSGTEKASFYASLSALSDPGWTLQSQVERYTGNFNVNYNISNSLSLNLISMGAYRKQKAPGTLGQTTEVVSGAVKRDFDINPYSYALNSSRALDPNTYYTMNYAPFNILNELSSNYMDLNTTDIKVQGELKWKALKSLELSGLVSYSYRSNGQEYNATDKSNQAMAYRAMGDATIRDKNSFLYKDILDNPYALPISVLPEGGIIQRTDYRMNSLDSRLSLSWVEEFNDKHIVNFYGGAETNSTKRGETWFTGVGIQYEMGKVPFYEYEYFKKLKETGANYYSVDDYINTMAAFFGSATYSYEGRYSLNLTGRYEGTNKMGKSRQARWLPTWNIGLGWNVHDEAFFKNIESIFSHLNLKASYSLTGEPVPEFVSNSSVIIQSYVPFRPFASAQESGLEISSLENSELTYEKKNELNIGAEMGFLKNRISFAFDWYTRNNYDLIGLINTQGIGGEVMKYGNVADMKSGGLEFTLTTQNIKTEDFDWTTNFIFGKNYTRITHLDNRARVIDLVSGVGYMREGYPVRELFSIKFMGLDENGVPTFLKEDGSISSFSNPRFDFQNRDGLESYLIAQGPTDPTITGSLGNLFRYKNFKLNIFTTYSFGNVVRLDPVFNAEYSDLTSMTREFKNRWMKPGDESKTNIPVIISRRQYDADNEIKQTYNAYNYSDIRIAKGDFIRLKEVSLTYDFPRDFITNVSALSLKLQATNLFLLYADKKLNGQDPEFFRSGGVATPVPKQFTLTLRAAF